MIAIILAFHDLRMQQLAIEKPMNWIISYKKELGNLPSVPEHLLPVVHKYSAGEPISKQIKLTIPSGQFWNGLLPSQQDQLLELVEWLGQDRRDYLEQMKRMLPKSPRIRWV